MWMEKAKERMVEYEQKGYVEKAIRMSNRMEGMQRMMEEEMKREEEAEECYMVGRQKVYKEWEWARWGGRGCGDEGKGKEEQDGERKKGDGDRQEGCVDGGDGRRGGRGGKDGGLIDEANDDIMGG